ncbi:MAG: AtpZ/AtpI family protein [Bradyrhizobiaceae bacterium]|nr:AtpZ/AtpI family protein [Bradyrhizobiaceae bacterium]
MADNARGSNESEQRRADEAALSARLRGLGEELRQHRPSEASDQRPGPPAANALGYARGFRLSSELVGGVLVGALVGWALDKALGTSPWGLIVFLLLGFVAGVVNVVRSAGVTPGNDPGRPPGS